ncbi:MAG: fructosamine kinase family protein [Bdellovibrionales bacterium]
MAGGVFRKSTAFAQEEAFGLDRLREIGAIQIVKVIECDDAEIQLESIVSERTTPAFWERFGRELAALHTPRFESFGFPIHNHIGATPQPNPQIPTSKISWADYFIRYRLGSMALHADIAEDVQLTRSLSLATPGIREILSEVNEGPSLVHGDLWSGNYLCSSGQTPVLIDPAPYFGHREVDLAMSELFGGFDPLFYQSYGAALPLEPGYEVRREIYNLYHELNHFILFGTHRSQALLTLEQIISGRFTGS